MPKLPNSTWGAADIRVPPPFPKLRSNLEIDVAIIGAGLTGLCTAYELARIGLKVAVFDKSEIGDGATGYTTAFVTCDIDTNLHDLIAMFGEERAKLIWESGLAAIDWLEATFEHEKIEADFKRCPLYIYANNKQQTKQLETEMKAAEKLGFTLNLHRDSELAFSNTGYLELPNQAKCHAIKLLFGLAEAAKKLGVEIYENTEIQQVTHGSKSLLITADGQEVTAPWVVITTYRPLDDKGLSRLRKGMYKSYVLEASVPKGKYTEAIYLDLESPYHYFRIDSGETRDRLIIGGEDHRMELKVSPEKNQAALRAHLERLIGKGSFEFVRHWAGPILEPSDGLPLIGIAEPKHILATAFSGNGFTYAPITAMLSRDLILGKPNPWIDLYSPQRISGLKQLIYKGRDYTQILFGGAIKNTFTKPK